MNAILQDSNWDETAADKNSVTENFELTDVERLCFTCPLPDCKEKSKKCLINIAKAKA